MSAVSTTVKALPPAIDAFMKQGAVQGPPMPLVKLNNQVPSRPIVMDNGGAYTITLYSGPSMNFSVNAKQGNLLGTA
jgi:hypothetical protein